ncbi:MAG: hypothetical protein ACRDD4_06725 [Culicoidibacterales bacterium]
MKMEVMNGWDSLEIFIPTNLEQWREEHDDEADQESDATKAES